MQLGLPLLIPIERRLAPADTLRSHLAATAEEIVGCIECGTIPHAFDLRANRAERSEVRVWMPTVRALMASDGRDPGARARDDIEVLLRELVPARDVRSSELERWWCVSHQHVHGLIAAGELRCVRGGAAGRGPSGFAVLGSEAITEFLRRRRLPDFWGNSKGRSGGTHATVAAT